MTLLLVFTAMAAAGGLLAGALFGWLYAVRKVRYRNPLLHEGAWHKPNYAGGAMHWHSRLGPQADVLARALRSGAHQHGVAVCTLTDALAHEDRCWCGALRFGVFGSWE